MEKHSKENDQVVLIANAMDIYDKLKELSEPIIFKEVEYPVSVDEFMYIRKNKQDIEISLKELLLLSEKYTNLKEFAKIQFKC